MTAPDLPEPGLQPHAVELLAAIRDHLNLPLYAEGDKAARRAWQELLEARTTEVVELLDVLLNVTVTDVQDTSAMLRNYRWETAPDYTTSEVPR